MFYLNVRAHTPVGEFFGTVNPEGGSKEDLVRTRDSLQSASMKYLVLFRKDAEITLPEKILSSSVIIFTIDDFVHEH